MKKILISLLLTLSVGMSAVELEKQYRLDTSSALKMLQLCHQEALRQKVDVAIIILGTDGRILASSKSEKMGPQLYDFAKAKAQTSWFKKSATEELPSRNGRTLELINLDRLKAIRGVKGGIPLMYRGHCVGAIGVSGAHQDIDKEIALKGQAVLKESGKKK